MTNPIEPCPPAIVTFVRQRIDERVAARIRDERSWKRWFIAGSRVPAYPCAEVRRFSECNLEARTCAGLLTGRWLVCDKQITTLDLDISKEDEFIRTHMVDTTDYIIFNFGLTVERDKCVIAEIELDGAASHAAYKLLNDVNSESLGPIIGQVIRERIKRQPDDRCMPEGWEKV